MPAPPEEFVATQVSRLNEALLVAYSAMSGTNLKAVDRVVKIVRELDRYHGLVAAARRFPDAPRLEASAQNALAFGPALFCRPEFAPQALERQDFEEIDSAPGNPMILEAALHCAGEEDATATALSSPGERSEMEVGDHAHRASQDAGLSTGYGVGEGEPSRAPQLGSDDRPENPPQDLEKAESAPATGLHAEGSKAAGAAPERSDASASGCEAQERRAPGVVGCPEKPAQGTERIELAPGNGSERNPPPALIETPFVELSRSETRWQNLHMTPNAVAAC